MISNIEVKRTEKGERAVSFTVDGSENVVTLTVSELLQLRREAGGLHRPIGGSGERHNMRSFGKSHHGNAPRFLEKMREQRLDNAPVVVAHEQKVEKPIVPKKRKVEY